MKALLISLIALTFILTSCSKNDRPYQSVVVVKGTGDITAKLNEFRSLLGSTLNTTPGADDGRREINWETIPNDFIGQPLPPDFFNPTAAGAPASRQRGLRYVSQGTFMVSDNNFVDINPEASFHLRAFSGTRSFANISSSLWEVVPEKPGFNIPATVSGFGIVFSDVDLVNSTFLEFYEADSSLGKYFVPPHSSSSAFSFMGVYFKDRRISRIRVGHLGNLTEKGSDVSNGGNKDFVSMDDFLYDEPKSVD